MPVAALPSRAVLKIEGADARGFLQGIVTQEIESSGGAMFAGLLTPQGKLSFDFFLIPSADGFVADCAAAHADALIKRLSMYRLRADVRILRLESWSVECAWQGVSIRACECSLKFSDPRLPDLGARAVRPLPGEADAGEADYDRHRIALGVPEFGKDFGPDEMFLLDVNYDALRGVSYKKGCFVGQEVTSRMKRKGEIRRRTLLAHFDGPPPPQGAEVVAGSSTLGEVLSGVEGMALANIRLDRFELAANPGAVIAAAGTPLHLSIPDYLKGV